jgi:hypothetical protein
MSARSTPKCGGQVSTVLFTTRGLVTCNRPVIENTHAIRSMSEILLSSSAVSKRQSHSECCHIGSSGVTRCWSEFTILTEAGDIRRFKTRTGQCSVISPLNGRRLPAQRREPHARIWQCTVRGRRVSRVRSAIDTRATKGAVNT